MIVWIKIGDWENVLRWSWNLYFLKGPWVADFPCMVVLEAITFKITQNLNKYLFEIIFLWKRNVRDKRTLPKIPSLSIHIQIFFNYNYFIVLAASANDDDCIVACTYIYDPICAFNGHEYRFFGNECFMNSMNTCNHEEFEPVDETFCDDENMGYPDIDQRPISWKTMLHSYSITNLQIQLIKQVFRLIIVFISSSKLELNKQHY
jgi:hypothetical protein